MSMMTGQPVPVIPFRKGTRQHFNPVGIVPYRSNAAGTPLVLDQIGLLSGLLIRVSGVMGITAGGALLADGPWSLVRRIRVTLNTGVTLVDLSGFGAYLVGFLLKEEFNPAASGLADVYAAPVATGANTWALSFWIPISSNDGINMEIGLINLQTEELRARVEIDWAAATDAVDTPDANGFSGEAEIHALWYEVPDPRVVGFPPLNILHRLIEDQASVTRTGDMRYPITRQGTIQQLIHTLRLDGERNAADVIALRLELNRSDRVYRYTRQAQHWFQAMRYGQDLPTGVFVWDWWHAQMDVSQGDGRDFVDTEAVAQIDSILEIASGATLGENNNALDTIRRFTQVLIP